MRTVWFEDLSFELIALLCEELGFEEQLSSAPQLLGDGYGTLVRHTLDLRVVKGEWESVLFMFLSSGAKGEPPAYETDLVLENGEPGMTERAVRLPRTAIDAALREKRLAPLRAAFDALAVLSDNLPARSQASAELRPFGDVLRCRACRTVITKPLLPVAARELGVPPAGGELVQEHQYGIVDATSPCIGYCGITAGAVITHTSSLVRTENLRERNTQDCCGFRADNGVNQVCATCRAELASFWCGHSSGDFVVLQSTLVEIIPASSLTSAERAELYLIEY